MLSRERIKMLVGILAMLLFMVIASTAERPKGNGVIVAGNTWGTYRPPHVPDSHPRNRYVEDFQTRGDNTTANGNWIFFQSRMVTSQLFGNPAFSWPFGKNIVDCWGGALAATIYDPRAEFASVNGNNYEAPPVEALDLNYSSLRYGSNIPGAGDPSRDYVNPGGKAGGGAIFTDDRKAIAYYEAGWPTNVGVDVKLKVYSITTPWGHLDDNHLVEVEFYNTGVQDLDNDGNVDFTDQKIHSLVMNYYGEPWFMMMRPAGNRGYNTGGYRPAAHDATPDENGSPWAYSMHSFGARNSATEADPGIGNQSPATGWYNDIAYGYTFVGAKSIDENGNMVGDKMLSFKNSSGEQVVHPTGEGVRRGWFQTNTNTESTGGTFSARNMHLLGAGSFFTDGGKSRSRAQLDLTPNPNLFASGDLEDLTTFIVKDDPSSWMMPDGAYEFSTPVFDYNGIAIPNGNPIAESGGRPLHIDYIHEGTISENNFNDVMQAGFGPFDLEVGERMRVYFVRAQGFRPKQLRGAIKAGRMMVEAISNSPDGSLPDPGAPAVPDIRVTGSVNVKPLIMFDDVADADGYKIYRSKAWPLFDPTTEGLMYEGVYWKTMTPGEENRPQSDPINPLLTDHTLIRPRNGEHWGPYSLVKVISSSELENFRNPRTQDAGQYPYAYEDSEDAFTLPGQTFYYYVASFKNQRANAPYDQLEDGSVSWIESGKVNVNGRDGFWQNTWHNTTRYAFFPDEQDSEALQAVGAAYTLVSPTVAPAELELERAKIVVRPNPYKRLAFHDVGTESKILFANLPQQATITILDISGQIVDKIDYTAPTAENGTYFWDMFSKDGTRVASGVYIWVVEHDRGAEKGTLAIIR